MSAPLYSNVVIVLMHKIDFIAKDTLFHGYHALAKTIAQPLALLASLFIILTGYAILRGIIKTPLQELIKFTIRFGLIYSLALNWNFFATYVVDLFVTGSEELAGVLLKTGKSYNGLTLGLQEVFSKIMRLGNSTLAQTSFRHPSPIITSLLIFASGMLVVGSAIPLFLILHEIHPEGFFF